MPSTNVLACLIQIIMPAKTRAKCFGFNLANQALNAADAGVTTKPPSPVAAGAGRPPVIIISTCIILTCIRSTCSEMQEDSEQCIDNNNMPTTSESPVRPANRGNPPAEPDDSPVDPWSPRAGRGQPRGPSA